MRISDWSSDVCSSDLATAQAIAQRAAERGIAMMDAPVTRTEMGKDGPFVFCMLGGDEAVKDRVQQVLDAFSTNTMHVGPLGSAMALKICNNQIGRASCRERVCTYV